MIIQKLLALLALLSSLTGCAGADAASLPPTDRMEPPVSYEETVSKSEEGEPLSEDEPQINGVTSDTYSGAAERDPRSGGAHTESHTDGAVIDEIAAPEAPEPLYTLYEPYGGSKSLTPRSDYGTLLPYVGGMSKQFSYALWGLVTADGRVVTDPIYGEARGYGPFLLLFRGGEYLPDGSRASEPEVTMAGKDGRWTLDAGDFHHSILLEGIGMAAAKVDGSVIILRPDGEITQTFTRAQLEPYLGTGYSWDDEDGKEIVYAGGPIAVCHWDDNSPYGNGAAYDCFMNPVTGEITGEPPADFAPENGWGDLDETPDFPGYDYPDRLEDMADGTVYYCGERDGQYNLLDRQGKVLMENFFTPDLGFWEPIVGAGLAGSIQNGAFQYARISSGEVVFRYPLSDR